MFKVINEYSGICIGTFHDLDTATEYCNYHNWLYEFELANFYIEDEAGNIY